MVVSYTACMTGDSVHWCPFLIIMIQHLNKYLENYYNSHPYSYTNCVFMFQSLRRVACSYFLRTGGRRRSRSPDRRRR